MNKILKKLYADREAVVEQMEPLAAIEAMSDEEYASFDGFKADLETIDKKIKVQEDMLEAKKYTPTAVDLTEQKPVKVADYFANPLQDEDFDASVIKVPAKAKRILAGLKCYKTPEAQDRAYAFGQHLRAMMGYNDSIQWCRDNGCMPINAVHNENTNTQGGYLVIPEFARDIIVLAVEYGIFQPAARGIPMTSDLWNQSRQTGGLTMYPVGESGQGTESTGSWDQIGMTRKEWMTLSRITTQLDQDAIISVMDTLATDVARASAQKRDQAGFIGDGTSTYHGISGISPELVTINGVTDGGGGVVLADASDSTWSSLTMAAFLRTVARVPEYPGIQSKWYCSKVFWATVMEALGLALGGNTVDHSRGGLVKTFLGYPVILTETMPTATAVSQITCLFGDISMSSVFGDRQATTIAFSDSATMPDGQNVFTRNQRAVRWTESWDINNHDLGTSSAPGPVVGLMTTAS